MVGRQFTPDWDALYQSRILPALGVRVGGAESPRWIFVCGQPGSGKSNHVARLSDELGPDLTQLISGDALCELLPELYRDMGDPSVQDALTAYEGRVQLSHTDALIERALELQAHVLCESHRSADMAERAILARALGYRVECVIFAVPLIESWLATLGRDKAAGTERGFDRRIAWSKQIVNYSRWPSFIARAEDQVVFDEIKIIGRNDEIFFHNTAAPFGDTRRWNDTPFAFESLLVERMHPRSAPQVDALLATWNALRAHPDIAFRNTEAWPHESILALGQQLQAMRDDPAVSYDLNQPAEDRDPQATAAWVSRLRLEVAAVLASPDAVGYKPLASRCDRFMALIERATGHPSR